MYTELYLITVTTIVAYSRSDINRFVLRVNQKLYSTQMATVRVKKNFPEQIKESRKKIQDSFKRSHEALQVRENILLSRVNEIVKEYNSKTLEMNKLVEALNEQMKLQSTLVNTNTDKEYNGIRSTSFDSP